jgi:hypothetical protein
LIKTPVWYYYYRRLYSICPLRNMTYYEEIAGEAEYAP